MLICVGYQRWLFDPHWRKSLLDDQNSLKWQRWRNNLQLKRNAKILTKGLWSVTTTRLSHSKRQPGLHLRWPRSVVLQRTETVSQLGISAIPQGSSLGCQRGSCSVVGGESSQCHAWTSQGEGRCVYACRRSPHPDGWRKLWRLRITGRPPPIEGNRRTCSRDWGRAWTAPLCRVAEHSWPPGWLGQTNNQLLISVVDAGEGKSLMASRYFGSGSMVESDTLNPAKSTLLSANWNLSGFSTMPSWPTCVRKSIVLHQCCSRSES